MTINTNTATVGAAAPGETEAAVIAYLAIAGHTVHKLPAGDYMVARWCHTRHCADLAALVAFAHQIGAR